MNNQTADYISLKPLADRFREVASTITDDEIREIIEFKIEEKVEEQLCGFDVPLSAIADEWIELSDEFYKGCDNVRDQYMVDHCDVLFAVWDGIKSGGVWSTIRKAHKAGKQIIYCPVAYKNRK